MSDAPPGNYIAEILVEDLYGEFTYPIGPLNSEADPRVIILYGDNGTGKSTILQLIRSLLSPGNNAGHRTRIAQIPFKKFEVRFRDGTVVSATRERELVGSYLYAVSGGGDISPTRVFVKADAENRVLLEGLSKAEQEQFQAFIRRLASISEEVTFLDDRRTFALEHLRDRARARARAMRNAGMHDSSWVIAQENEAEDPVAAAVSMLVESVRRETLLRQRRGSGDAQSIYKNLIATLARGATPSQSTVEDLTSRLVETERLSGEFSAIGFTSPIRHSEMIQYLDSAAQGRREVVADLLSAYVESTEAWFGALKELKALLDKYVARLNFFMAPKKVTFTVSDGLQFRSKEGRLLSLESMSSGERHLVVMLTQALLRRNDTSVMVIDEPELSLNMKWQRELVGAILDCLGGGASQVVMATHSIEIAARYRKNVVRLWSKEQAQDEAND